MTEHLLDQIVRFLDEEAFPYYKESKGANDGSDALMLSRESWGTIVQISVWKPSDLPEMVHFWVPVLNNVGWQPGDKEPEEQEVIQNKAINEVSLLNDEQLIGRWRYNYRVDRIDLEHELLAVDLTKDQLIGTIEVLASYTSICGFLQARCGGMSWVEWTRWSRGEWDTAIDSATANRTAANPADPGPSR